MQTDANTRGSRPDNQDRVYDEASSGAWINGSCHCRAVLFRCQLPEQPKLIDCNCSICAPLAYLHWLVPKKHFQLLRGQACLAEYRFNTGTAAHWFCSVCGIKPFYQPRSHPHHFSVNARCLHDVSWRQWPRQNFNGRQWEKHINNLR